MTGSKFSSHDLPLTDVDSTLPRAKKNRENNRSGTSSLTAIRALHPNGCYLQLAMPEEAEEAMQFCVNGTMDCTNQNARKHYY